MITENTYKFLNIVFIKDNAKFFSGGIKGGFVIAGIKNLPQGLKNSFIGRPKITLHDPTYHNKTTPVVVYLIVKSVIHIKNYALYHLKNLPKLPKINYAAAVTIFWTKVP